MCECYMVCFVLLSAGGRMRGVVSGIPTPTPGLPSGKQIEGLGTPPAVGQLWMEVVSVST